MKKILLAALLLATATANADNSFNLGMGFDGGYNNDTGDFKVNPHWGAQLDNDDKSYGLAQNYRFSRINDNNKVRIRNEVFAGE